ncbi:ankyrin repeat domain-containing protein [Staphylospora marina]|uniref:ankyrin repeat domain-containing protein n=1 Tax=Staphylospora marina TaxID=2490858 RepID=UPI000F5BB413|nr:ankyrin repeat domain-containing protein [Staphylospora marina]
MTVKELFQACEQGDFQTLKILLEKNPEWIHATSKKEIWGMETLLHAAPTPEIASYLLDLGIPVDVSVDPNIRWTPVLAAARRQNWDTVRFLIQRGADVFVRDSRKMGLLEAAIDDGQFDLAEELLDRLVPVEVKGVPMPALELAYQKGPLQLIRRMLGRMADVNADIALGEFALKYAIDRGDVEIVRCLLEAGTDRKRGLFHVRDPYDRGEISFHVAKELFFLLLQSGAPTIIETRNILHNLAGASEEWIPVMKQIPGFHELVRMRDHHGRLPQHYASSKKMFEFLAKSSGIFGDRPIHDHSKPDPDEPPGQIILLHPWRDELVIAVQGGVLSHWRYTPRLEWVCGVQTDQHDIHDLLLSPDGEWFAMTARKLYEVQLRRFDDLSVIRSLEGEEPWTYNKGMITPDGGMLIVECKNGGNLGYTWFQWESGKSGYALMNELGIHDGSRGGDLLSSDGEKWAFVVMEEDEDEYEMSLNVVPTPFDQKGWKKSCSFDLYPAWIIAVLGTAFHPDSDRVFFYLNVSDWKDGKSMLEDRLIACSVSENRMLWSVTLTTGIARDDEKLPDTPRLVVKGDKIACATPESKLFFLDVQTGSVLREVPVNGKILAIGLHPDGDKLRVATDRKMHLVEWKPAGA